MTRVVVLAGGSPHAHDFPAIGVALDRLLTTAGYDVDVVAHPDDAARRVASGVDSLVIDALWWRMSGDAYEPWRADYGYSPPPETRAALTEFVATGGGLVALHTTPICFDDWPEWGDVLGGVWRWGASSHPPYGPVVARIIGRHQVVGGLPHEITLHDEVYGDLDIRDDVHVLAVAKRHPDDADQPVIWVHRYGAGRVVFNGFGHDAGSIRHEHNSRLVRQAVAWVSKGGCC